MGYIGVCGRLINALAILTSLVCSIAVLINVLLVSAGIKPINAVSNAKPIGVIIARVIVIIVVIAVVIIIVVIRVITGAVVAAIGAILNQALTVSARIIPIQIITITSLVCIG